MASNLPSESSNTVPDTVLISVQLDKTANSVVSPITNPDEFYAYVPIGPKQYELQKFSCVAFLPDSQENTVTEVQSGLPQNLVAINRTCNEQVVVQEQSKCFIII